MMISSGGRSTRFPFTAMQWQELEHQALLFRYIVSGMPIPSDLLFTITSSLHPSLSCNFLDIHRPHHIGWSSSFPMGFGRKVDPEPGRCRRTDGKKWRCSKEAYPDSKYCERHMHRGRNRSRKPVEVPPPNAMPVSHRHTSPYLITSPSEPHFLSPHSSSSSKLTPLTLMASSQSQFKYSPYSSDSPWTQSFYDDESDDHRPKKVMHHFLDERAPKDKDSWTDSDDKVSSPRTDQLSISMPNYMHDFFVTQNEEENMMMGQYNKMMVGQWLSSLSSEKTCVFWHGMEWELFFSWICVGGVCVVTGDPLEFWFSTVLWRLQ